MSLISRLFDAVQSWRRGRGGPKVVRRADVSMEQLDHRQLLSVDFTGIVATDFPVSMVPGVVVLPDNPSVTHPSISPALLPVVKVSGFDINGIRVSYSAARDTLSIGLEQPLSQQAGQPGPVIAGDADNNGNDGTVNPAVTAIAGAGFQDFAQFGGSESMGAFLDLKGTGYADVVAGYAPNDPQTPKEYQVAQAVVDTSLPPTVPSFGTQLAVNAGNVYKNNSKNHPNLEFTIAHFSQLYLQETGHALTPDSVIKVGAFGGSQADLGIGEAYFPEASVKISNATVPATPPLSPTVLVNPHSDWHINTAHDTRIRVNVLGTSGFDVNKIDPNSVTLGGAHPLYSFTRFIIKDGSLDATFVFRGTDVKLPPGLTVATVSGNLTDGTSFSTAVRVFNKDASFFSAHAILAQQQRQTGRETRANGFVILPSGSPVAGSVTAAQTVDLGVKTSKPLNVVMSTSATTRPASAPPVAAPLTVNLGVSSAKPLNVVMDTGKSLGTSTKAAPVTVDLGVKSAKAMKVVMGTGNGSRSNRSAPTPVSIPTGLNTSGTSAATGTVATKISRRLQASTNKFVRKAGAVNLSAGTPLQTGSA